MRKTFLILCAGGAAQASYDAIVGYMPNSGVTDHNAIDLDQLAFENVLDSSDRNFEQGYYIYSQGGNSRSQATFTWATPLFMSVASSTSVRQDNGGVVASGALNPAYTVGGATMRLRYSIGDSQASYVGCRAGAIQTAHTTITGGLSSRAAPLLTGCFTATSDLCIGGTGTVAACTGGTIIPAANITSVAMSAGRTMRGFSVPSARSYTGCPGCPYKDYMYYYTYFGVLDYGNQFVLAALGNSGNSWAGTTVTWGTGSPAATDFPIDLTGASVAARVEYATKGTAYLITVMYAIREFEDAIDDCSSGNLGLNDEPVHAWDEGVAFYAGSLEGAYGTRGRGVSPAGVQYYNLADYRCQNFATCSGANSISGTSNVNRALSVLFARGQNLLLMGQCTEVRAVTEAIVDQMRIPAIQGTLRYVYRIRYLMGTGINEVLYAEAATFAAAVIPAVHFCSATAATTIAQNTNGAPALQAVGGANTDFAAVKAAFESVYSCLNITCADVGGFWNTGASTYYTGGEPCQDPVPPPSPPPAPVVPEEKIPGWGIALIVIFSAMSVVMLLCFGIVISREKAGRPLFINMPKGGSA
jgi:hypothetical protein